MGVSVEGARPGLDVLVDGLGDADVAADIDDLAAGPLEVEDAFRVPAGRDDDLDVLGEPLGQPEGDVGLLAGLLVGEAVDCLDHDHYLVVDLLRAVDDLLLLDLRADDVQPVGEELPDVLLEQVDVLLELERLLELGDELVEGVEVVAVVAAPACEVHDREDLLLLGLVAQAHALLPLAQDALHPAPRLRLEHQRTVALFLQPPVDLVNMLFLPRPYSLRLVVVEHCLAGTE